VDEGDWATLELEKGRTANYYTNPFLCNKKNLCWKSSKRVRMKSREMQEFEGATFPR
jgi:hypothetical protein